MKHKKKIGRNDLCPCGSGIKHKKCCLDKVYKIPTQPMPENMKLFMEGQKALEEQRKDQQGLSKGIISTVHQGYRFVAIGPRLMYKEADKWQTVTDFLIDYIISVFTGDWFQNESKKPENEMHPIVYWGEALRKLQRQNSDPTQKVQSAEMTGPVERFLRLSYTLYLLAHNAELQERLIKRLKRPEFDQFLGAYNETIVFSAFILAGFNIEIEDESNSANKHAEFFAISENTKEKYWVEAKCKSQNSNPGIKNQLFKALSKDTDSKRIICINTNIDQNINPQSWGETISSEIRSEEETLKIKGTEPDQAYLIVFNAPISNSDNHSFSALFDSFKIDNLGFNKQLPFREVVETYEMHKDIFHLFECLKSFQKLPSTFDGSLPELSHNGLEQQFIVGQELQLNLDDGSSIKGTLKMATVNAKDKLVWCVLTQKDGTDKIVSVPMTEEEYQAYKNNPDTFIAQPQNQTKIEDGDYHGLYRSFLKSFKATPKKRLLELFDEVNDELRNMPRDELAKEYVIRCVENIINQDRKKK